MAHRPFVPKKGEGTGSHRPARFAERLKEELVDLIPGELKDPRLYGISFLTITSVDVTPDLKHGTVLFALMGQSERAAEVEEALNAASGFLRRQLMHRMETKITPQLVFKYDKGIEHTSEISSLLKTIK